MSNCKDSNKGCGCEDQPLTTFPTFQCPPDEQCPTPNPCEEFYNSFCVFYENAGIEELGTEPGESLQSIIQKLTLFLTNPGCVTPGGTCLATTNLYPVIIYSNSITMAWDPSATSTDYQVEYKEVSAGVWSVLPTQPATDPTQVVIGGLTENTEYNVRVNCICALGSCYSVTLKIKTKA